jgi:hypothetical protein
MKNFLLMMVAAAAFLASGCTVFTDDLYMAQSGQYGATYRSVDRAIYDEFRDRFGDDRVFRADLEANFNHWTAISDQMVIGLERQRMRISAYPSLDADGQLETVVVARKEIYAGQSFGSRGRPTANYANRWLEIGRDAALEAAIANGVNSRLREANAGGN